MTIYRLNNNKMLLINRCVGKVSKSLTFLFTYIYKFIFILSNFYIYRLYRLYRRNLYFNNNNNNNNNKIRR